MREPLATRAAALGLLSLPVGVVSPFAVWIGYRSLRNIRTSGGRLGGWYSAAFGFISGIVAGVFLIGGIVYWLLLS